jgi:hypothetical protein
MSKLCQGPSCHMYDTTDRKRGPKGNKRNITRNVGTYNYGGGNFCKRYSWERDEHVSTHYYFNVCTREERPLTESQFNDSTYTLNT